MVFDLPYIAKNLDKKFHFMYSEFLHLQYSLSGLPKIWTKSSISCTESFYTPSMLYKGCQKSGQKVPFHVQGVFTPPVCYIRVAKNQDTKFHFMYREFLHPQYAILGLPKIWTKKFQSVYILFFHQKSSIQCTVSFYTSSMI